MLLVWLAVPIEATVGGYLFGAFFLLLCLAVFLTNQFHKWAHMEDPPSLAVRLQRGATERRSPTEAARTPERGR